MKFEPVERRKEAGETFKKAETAQKWISLLLGEFEVFLTLKSSKFRFIGFLYIFVNFFLRFEGWDGFSNFFVGLPEKEIKRPLGLLVLRGENIVSITAEAPPNQSAKRNESQRLGPGRAHPMVRSGQIPISGLAQPNNKAITQPPVGLGLPNQASMLPNSKK